MSNVQGALVDLLAAWLPAQRWFAGGDVGATATRITSVVVLVKGDPELRHLMVLVTGGRSAVSYQLAIGLRAQTAPESGPAVIGRVEDGRIAYDALGDPELAGLLLRGIASGRQVGPLRFAAEPGAVFSAGLPGRVLSAEQSNTSIVFGDDSILKVLRRPHAGIHPDLEVPGALARRGSRLVAPPLGRIELDPSGDSGTDQVQPVLLAILSRYFPGATSAWDLATATLGATPADFTSRARTLGTATAGMHTELAGAFGVRPLPQGELAGEAARMNDHLDAALAEVPRLRQHEDGLRACYAALAQHQGEVLTQRVHGDYHLGQVLATNGGWIVLDFEGEPSVPLEQRRAFAPPMRDVAGMLRSFDYAARQQLLTGPAGQLPPERALSWAEKCQAAFCDGYASACGVDPRASGPLLRALIMAKAVYEAVYEARHRPDWLPIPLAAIAEGI